jgi:glycerate kinase
MNRARPVVVAVDSFKGSIPAAAAAAALREGWRSVDPDREVVLAPMADGGEGTLDAFAAAVPGGVRMPVTVSGPAGTPVETSWLLLPPTPEAPGGTGVVELASTSGIELLGTPPRLRPWDADTRGFGEAIAAALARGVSRLVLGIGSSASTDAGAGMLAALGARLTDDAGRPIARGARGLRDLATADLAGLPPLPPGGITVLTDVTSPLLGEHGAAAVFGPQKGAAPGDIRALDAALARVTALVPGDPTAPGAGAAGGTGYGLLAWGARLEPGAAAVAGLIGLGEIIAGAAFVITGEGSYDGQSAAGKVTGFVRTLAVERGVPVALVAGRIASDAPLEGFAATISLVSTAGSVAAALGDPARWLRAAGEAIAREASRI